MEQPLTHQLRSGKAYSIPFTATAPSHASKKIANTTAQKITAIKKLHAANLAKKQRKAHAVAKRQASIQAAIQAKAAQTASAIVQRASQDVLPSIPLPIAVKVEKFARPWVDEETGHAVELDEVERGEIKEIVDRANECWITILKIQRVYNEVLEKQFLEKKQEFGGKNIPTDQALVFHGTSRACVTSYAPLLSSTSLTR
jgi:hypothetical protein